jgi:hypothetical protein
MPAREELMNPANSVQLQGIVQEDSRDGMSNWTRYRQNGHAQVRFWLAVSRDTAGDGWDVLLCAIEPRSGEELLRLERELTRGRTVKLCAIARSLQPSDNPHEDNPGVIFIAEECGLDGKEASSAHRVGCAARKHHAHGKMAAAGDVEQEELLPLEVEVSR